jgi:hypothetical protein
MPVLLALSVGACTGISDLSREDYRRGYLLISPLSEQKLVVLPMRAPRANVKYLKSAETLFLSALSEMRGAEVEVVPPGESSDVSAEIFGAPSTNRVVFEAEMKTLKERFKTPLFLQTELTHVEAEEGATHVRIYGRLWDAESGNILWEANGESRGHVFLFFPTVPASFEKIAESASRGLIRKMPSFSPDEPNSLP